VHKLQLRGPDPGPVITPGPVHFTNILHDFVTDSDDDNSNIEEKEKEDRDSSVESGPISRRKAGHRYTKRDFDFLDEDWLHSTNESSEEDISDEISETD
jgi:hypothetical protein